MFTCKSVSKSLHSKDYYNLPLVKRIALKLHVALCIICGRYNKQVMQMQDICHDFRTESRKQGEAIEASLEPAKKQRLEAVLKEKMADKPRIPDTELSIE